MLKKTEITFQAIHEVTLTRDTPEELGQYTQFWAVSRRRVNK